MLNGLRVIDRPFAQLLAASIVAGFTLQTEWAMGHDFEHFDVRVFASALVIFIFVLGIRTACRRLVPDTGDGFDARYGESVLLLSVIPAFLVVENTFLRVVGIVIYGAVIVDYGSTVLRIEWLRRAVHWVSQKTAWLFRVATQAPVSYVVQDDVEKGVLKVSVSTREGAEPSVAEIKRRVSALYQELPKTGMFEKIKVDVDGVELIDGMLPVLLEPVSHYAALAKIEKVTVVSRKSRLQEVSSTLPVERFSVESSGND